MGYFMIWIKNWPFNRLFILGNIRALSRGEVRKGAVNVKVEWGLTLKLICEFSFFRYIRKNFLKVGNHLFFNVSLVLHSSVAVKPLKKRGHPWIVWFSSLFKINRRLFINMWQKALFFLRLLCKPGPKLKILEVSAASLAQLVVHLTAGREVAGSYPRTGPILRVLKELRNECSVFALLTSRSSRGSVDHVKIGVHCPQLVLSC